MTESFDAGDPVLYLAGDEPVVPQPPNPAGIPDFTSLRRLGIWLPVTAIGSLIVLVEGLIAYLHLPYPSALAGHALMLGLIAAGAYAFSGHIFSIIRRKEEDLHQKHEELTAQERRFRALIENSSDGIVLLTANGTFRYASPSTARLLGYTGQELLGRSGFGLIHPEDRDDAMARFPESLRNPGQSFRAEFRIRHQDGPWRWVEAVLRNLLADSSVQAIVGNYRDITERKHAEGALRQAHDDLERRVRERTDDLVRANDALQATLAERQQTEEALRESRAQFAGIIGSAMEAIITIDAGQRILLFNAAAERTFRVSAAEVIGQEVFRFIPERFLPTHQAGFRDFDRVNLEKWWIGVLATATAVRADGEEFPIEAAVSQVEVGGQKLYTIILRDITERKRAEEELRASREQLRALAGRLLTIREEERARIARQLDEGLGQDLTALRLHLAWLASQLSPNQEDLMEILLRLLPVADAMISAVRRIGTELRPEILDDLGLVAALEWQAQEFQARTGIRCEFISVSNDVPLNPEASTALFRICQEALTNAACHAHATQVHISLREETGTLVLSVGDNGRGITEQELAHRTSLGLLSMRERALRVGGEVAIAGRPRAGTMVTVRLPVGQAISKAASGDQPE